MRGGVIRFGHDERDAVAVVTHGVIAQDRLVGVDQSVAIVRHVLRGEHGNDARYRQRCRAVDREDARVAAARESIGQVGDTITEKSRGTIKGIDDFVRDRPWQAAGIGVAAGLLIGLLLIGSASRSRQRP